MNSPSRKHRRAVLWSLYFTVLVLAVSCSAPALRNQFRNYNEAYADALNQQMLLNLARLENGHPAYYLAIGLIDNKFTFSSQTGAGSTGSYTETKTTANNQQVSGGLLKLVSQAFTRVLTSVVGYSANETVTSSSNPEFQFIPINNETAARQVLEPMPTDVFLALYQQGYPIDQLMRVMIERIEPPRLPNGEQLVLVNSPTCGMTNNYGRFLRVCAILRELQTHGYLRMETSPKFEPLGPVSFGQGGKSGQSESDKEGGRTGQFSPGKESSHGPSTASESNPNPAIKDFTDAEDKSLLLTNVSGDWKIYRKRPVPKFVLQWEDMTTNLPMDVLAGLISSDEVERSFLATQPTEEQKKVRNYVNFVKQTISFVKTRFTNKNSEPDYSAITNLVLALSSGVVIQTDVRGHERDATYLVLRSFNRAMDAVAGEQAGFDALIKTDSEFREMVPPAERRPILQMRWDDYHGTNGLEPPLDVVYYANKTYKITDPITSPLDPTGRWNRDVFRLMVALGSQVTVDISKFQRQVLELSQ